MTFPELAISTAVGAALLVGGFIRLGSIVDTSDIEFQAQIMERVALDYSSFIECPIVNGDALVVAPSGVQIPASALADTSTLRLGGFLSNSELNSVTSKSGVTWSVTSSALFQPMVSLSSTTPRHVSGLARKYNGVITGNTVVFMAIKKSPTADDSHIRELVVLNGGKCATP